METSVEDQSRQYILDVPVRAERFADLPAKGEPGKLYRVNCTRQYYKWVGEHYVLTDHRENFRWLPVEQVFGPLLELAKKIRTFEWMASRNGPNVAYINIRVNTRTGDCLVTDNAGQPLSIEELQYQQPRIARALEKKAEQPEQ